VSVSATVVVPTHDHGPTLRFALESVLAQTSADFEVFVIGDGVQDVTRELVAELARADERIRFFDHPKGARHGEAYRHEALAEAAGEIVCYQSDDDLWLPEHLATVGDALADADFVAAHCVHVTPDGELLTWPNDLALPWFREQMRTGAANYVPLSCAAHTLAAYRRLPEGWTPAPESSPTDIYMWRKVLGASWLRARTTTPPTVLHFPSSHRRGWTIDERVEELAPWARNVADPAWRCEFTATVLDLVMRRAAAAEAEAGVLARSRTWRLRSRLARALRSPVASEGPPETER